MTDCIHRSARVEHKSLHGSEAQFWIACPDCGGYWTMTGNLDRNTSSISKDHEDYRAKDHEDYREEIEL